LGGRGFINERTRVQADAHPDSTARSAWRASPTPRKMYARNLGLTLVRRIEKLLRRSAPGYRFVRFRAGRRGKPQASTRTLRTIMTMPRKAAITRARRST